MIPTGIYAWSNQVGGVHWYRQAEPLRVAAQAGIRTGVGNRLDNEVCESFDTILVHMLWDPTNSNAWEKLARQECHRLIFDIDDVMWDPDWQPFANHYTPAVLAQVWTNIKLAHIITTPSPVIAEKVAKVNPNVWVCPNTVPAWLLDHRMPPRPTNGTVRRLVGYQGSPSHAGDWSMDLLTNLVAFLRDNPTWGMHFWGPKEPPEGWPAHHVGYTPWQESVPAYYRTLSMDIGIGPLKNTPFNRGKSGLRAIEYAALGIPAIVSAGPAYDPWIDHGLTGLLIEEPATIRAWYNALQLLATDDQLRTTMSTLARDKARAWTTEANIGRWTEAWNSV